MRRRLALHVADARTLKAIPDDTLTTPSDQPLDSARNEPEFAGHLRILMHNPINVEGSDVAAFEVFRVVFRMITAHSPPDPVVPGDSLAEVEQHWPCGVSRAQLAVILDDLRGRNRRAVAFAPPQRLRVVRLVAVHPADDGAVIEMPAAGFVLVTNHFHAGLLERDQLVLGWSLPEANVEVES